jgi:HEAT repeat protein
MSVAGNDWPERARQLTEEARRDPRSTHDLISQALIACDEDEVDSRWWDAVNCLRYRATREAFEAACSLCGSGCADERRLGADILNKFGEPERAFADESLAVLTRMASSETDSDVLHGVCCALGSLDVAGAVAPLLTLKCHPEPYVRYGVALALCRKEAPDAIEGLIELSRDKSEIVRDWATTGLGSLTDVDTPALRDALVARVDDTDAITRAEALAGLARRKDERALGPLLEALRPERIGDYSRCQETILNAAKQLADPRLLPSLYRLNQYWGPGSLDDLIRACGGAC